MRAGWAAAAALLLGLGWAVPARPEEPPPVTGAHADLACDDCHGSGRVTDCWECHEAVENPHPVGVSPTIPLPDWVPLGPDGALLCRSCHRLHGGDPATRFLAGPAGATRLGFCVSCHGSRLEHADPHKARRGPGRCEFCHARKEGVLQTGPGTARLEIKRLCNFCHDVLAKGHPRNVDPSLEIPDGLPLQAGGAWSCYTCHDPHGTTDTTHLLRSELARHLERGLEENPHRDEYFACKACHTSSLADEITAPDYKLRYRGDVNVLCISCHVTDRSHHPTGLKPPPAIRRQMDRSDLGLPLGANGEITCYTCHDNGCAAGRMGMTERYYDRAASRSDLCGACHDRSALTATTPHVDRMDRCTVCHLRTPVPGVTEARTGLVAIPRFVCLRCHDVKPHPVNADHIRVPTDKIQVDPSLPLGPGGEVTCPTCHDPHASDRGFPARLRAAPGELCSLCHWR